MPAKSCLNLKVINRLALICSGSLTLIAFFPLFFLMQSHLSSTTFSSISFFSHSSSSTHLFSSFIQRYPFPLAIFNFFIFVFMFFIFTPILVCDWSALCYVATCATNLSSDVLPAVGGSLWSLGLGSALLGPPAPGRLHRSISWAGTIHHMCAPAPSPKENSWCSVFLLTCTIQWATSTNQGQYVIKHPLMVPF